MGRHFYKHCQWMKLFGFGWQFGQKSSSLKLIMRANWELYKGVKICTICKLQVEVDLELRLLTKRAHCECASVYWSAKSGWGSKQFWNWIWICMRIWIWAACVCLLIELPWPSKLIDSGRFVVMFEYLDHLGCYYLFSHAANEPAAIGRFNAGWKTKLIWGIGLTPRVAGWPTGQQAI